MFWAPCPDIRAHSGWVPGWWAGSLERPSSSAPVSRDEEDHDTLPLRCLKTELYHQDTLACLGRKPKLVWKPKCPFVSLGPFQAGGIRREKHRKQISRGKLGRNHRSGYRGNFQMLRFLSLKVVYGPSNKTQMEVRSLRQETSAPEFSLAHPQVSLSFFQEYSFHIWQKFP